MRIVLQRVSTASVDVEGNQIANIDRGLLLLVGIGSDDAGVDLAKTAKKIIDLQSLKTQAAR